MNAASHTLVSWFKGNWRIVVPGAMIWATLMTASAIFSPALNGWEDSQRKAQMFTLFALGGLGGFPSGLRLAQKYAADRPPESRFAAALLCFLLATIAATSALYILFNENFFLERDEPALSWKWLLDVLWSVVASFYQFAMFAMRLYFPVGFCAFFMVAVWFARLPH